MDDRSGSAGDSTSDLIIVGLGPGDLDRLPAAHRRILEDPTRYVVTRTRHHPAAAQLGDSRPVETCDDLYEQAARFDDVYSAIVDRVLERASEGPTVYAVPGSPLIGEFAVRMLLDSHPRTEVLMAESFVDAITSALRVDPLARGLRILDGHHLPDPLALDGPTIIGHLDAPAVLAEAAATIARVLPEGSEVTVCANLGSADSQVVTVAVESVPAEMAGYRTSLYVDVEPAGLIGAVRLSHRLRLECPWDMEQTHTSLITHLIEEVHELIEAISGLPDDPEVDYVAYDGVEEELGDVLCQILFHAAIAQERGVFSIDDVGTRLSDKLVRRHPHVFGDVVVDSPEEVASNWQRIKSEEKGAGEVPGSLLDRVGHGLPALQRATEVQKKAATAGFDWESSDEVVEVLAGEVEELRAALDGRGDPMHELGDVMFTAVNLARHLACDPESTLRRAVSRFEARFRKMESEGPLDGLDAADWERRWKSAKELEDGGVLEGGDGDC
ncbi:nucleoside triphosphate pyrophosphohydrolase [soil metagenome]